MWCWILLFNVLTWLVVKDIAVARWLVTCHINPGSIPYDQRCRGARWCAPAVLLMINWTCATKILRIDWLKIIIYLFLFVTGGRRVSRFEGGAYYCIENRSNLPFASCTLCQYYSQLALVSISSTYSTAISICVSQTIEMLGGISTSHLITSQSENVDGNVDRHHGDVQLWSLEKNLPG